MCAMVLFTACSRKPIQINNTESDSNSCNVNTEIQNNIADEIIHKRKVVSGNGKYILYETDREDPDLMSRSSVHLYNTITGTYIHIADTVSYPSIEFIADEKCYIQTSDSYKEYDMAGNLLFNMGDFFKLGDIENNEYVFLSHVFLKKDGSYVFRYFDTSNNIRPSVSENAVGMNMPFNVKVGIMLPDGTVNNIIDTGKPVETRKSQYSLTHMELLDENTLAFYEKDWYGEGYFYYGTVNLSTGEVKVSDYKPEYNLI